VEQSYTLRRLKRRLTTWFILTPALSLAVLLSIYFFQFYPYPALKLVDPVNHTVLVYLVVYLLFIYRAVRDFSSVRRLIYSLREGKPVVRVLYRGEQDQEAVLSAIADLFCRL